MSAEMPKMPEPVAFYETEGDEWHIYPRGTSTYEHIRDHQKARIGVHVFALYTAAQLQEAARQAMERAAVVCDELAAAYMTQAQGGDNTGASDHRAQAAEECACDIRALLPNEEKRHG